MLHYHALDRVGGAEEPRPLTEPLVRVRKRLLMLAEPIHSLVSSE